jgi:hypothetical protein
MSCYYLLDEKSPKILQPGNLCVQLMHHQKTAVYAMKELENKGYVDIKFRYYDNEEKDLRIDTNIGILGDKVGSGKTLIIYALLLELIKPVDKFSENMAEHPPLGCLNEARATYYASDKYTTIKSLNKAEYNVNINVIIVPKGIQHQWDDILLKYSNNNIRYINHIDNNTKEKINELDAYLKEDSVLNNESIIIVLCNDKSVNDICEKYNGKKWNRLIVDEADTIQIAMFGKMDALFIWLVTGTTNGITHSKKKYIKDIFGKKITWQPEFLTIKNKNDYIESSINLPRPNRIIIKCHTPREVRLLSEHIPKNIMNMINAGNTDEAIKNLNCHADTTDNIFIVISKNYESAIKNKRQT